ncbi:MAG TPA: carboxypeptidase regulatory-like domain-containing protein [Thermoanaerobaculia bacterium]|nr:carboxypeptidase regulatory-like domain-containing protein [Thermoanaerobaculia bacterium]
MRTLAVLSLIFSVSVSAADLEVAVKRNGFLGPVEVAVAPRVEGRIPVWSATKTLAADQSAAVFTGLEKGLYIVLLSGPQPLQKLSGKVNVGADGAKLRFALPETRTSLRVLLAGKPLAGAGVELIHDELRWSMKLDTGDDGQFAGALWEPGRYTASVQRNSSAPHQVDVTLSQQTLTIDIPDRTVAGQVIGDDGEPIANALVALRSQNEISTLTIRTTSGADGRFEFFGAREGSHSLSARAQSYVDSDAISFELHGAPAHQKIDLALTHGAHRPVRVVDERGHPVVDATLFTACDGHVKSTTHTNAEGRADVAVPNAGVCTIYALPKEGSIAIGAVTKDQPVLLRVRDGSSSLRLALKSELGEPFPDFWVVMSIDGTVIPPAVARQLVTRGFSLRTDAEGTIALTHIPPGTYEFWPYRSDLEGQRIYEVADGFAAPISVNVLTGKNSATVRFQAR